MPLSRDQTHYLPLRLVHVGLYYPIRAADHRNHLLEQGPKEISSIKQWAVQIASSWLQYRLVLWKRSGSQNWQQNYFIPKKWNFTIFTWTEITCFLCLPSKLPFVELNRIVLDTNSFTFTSKLGNVFIVNRNVNFVIAIFSKLRRSLSKTKCNYVISKNNR